jgi:hypothetical protein
VRLRGYGFWRQRQVQEQFSLVVRFQGKEVVRLTGRDGHARIRAIGAGCQRRR